MALEVITDHEVQALKLLLEQYKGDETPKIQGVIASLAKQIQELEDTYDDMQTEFNITNGEGQVLDEIGEIVVQDRLGFGDDFYKNLLRSKIGENTSQGEIDKIADITAILTQANLVHVQEWFPAGIGLYFDADVPANLIDFFYQRLDRIEQAAVRLEALVCFDPNEAFAFEGGPGTALGFGDSTNAAEGGIWPELKVRTEPAFSFEPQAGVTDGDEGFGTIDDPLVGGIMRA